MKLLGFLAGILLSSTTFAAPDEEILGKSQGYPVCPLFSGTPAQSCLVGQLSNFDKIAPARKVAKGPEVLPLHRATERQDLGVDEFMQRHRNTGLLILKGDMILAERYQYDRTADHRFQSASMSKTVVAMLVGVALHESAVGSIDDQAAKYVPALKAHPYGETPLRHLLTMSSGVRFDEQFDGPPGDGAVFRRLLWSREGPGAVGSVMPFNERVRSAGEKFVYASPETQVLALVLRSAVNRSLAEYLSEKIWQPMGAEADATWNIDATGHETGPSGINATLRDWGRFGLLLANDGIRDGRQIIPAAWVRAATSPGAPHLRAGTATRGLGYGYQTWVLNEQFRHFALLGVRGQAVLVAPFLKLVVVHTAVDAKESDPAALTERIRFFNSIIKKLTST